MSSKHGWQATWEAPPPPHRNPVVVSGLDLSAHSGEGMDPEGEIQKAFEACGKVSGVTIPRNVVTGFDFGLAYVKFESDKDAELCLKKMAGQEVLGAKVDLGDGKTSTKAFQRMREALKVQHAQAV